MGETFSICELLHRRSWVWAIPECEENGWNSLGMRPPSCLAHDSGYPRQAHSVLLWLRCIIPIHSSMFQNGFLYRILEPRGNSNCAQHHATQILFRKFTGKQRILLPVESHVSYMLGVPARPLGSGSLSLDHPLPNHGAHSHWVLEILV